MAYFPPPLFPSHVTGGGSSHDQWRVILAGPPVGPATLGGAAWVILAGPPVGPATLGGAAWVDLSWAPPHTEKYSFLPRSP